MSPAYRLIESSLLILAFLSTSTWSAQLPAISRPADAAAIRQIYAGKTWAWKKRPTGIYFAPSGALQAYENAPDERVGTGSWRVDDKGRLCVDIRWQRTAGGDSRHKSCWSHRRVGSVIWKQHDARSEWYSVSGRSREGGRISDGDRISPAVDRARARR
ncbi:DUF995 domain-containing protein [Antarcticirhabdus aurantiaca]|uniref:DUF995 domain-containing protein n=1 Tax=Antarcticirhabdus aurantiaca TaxID=2606717 RepID=A0ACD4NSG9_9HYPH|nr:DUF995 domain-containing protein [Antarcticirhabdus aurantiaca]WAJ29600.1 DUF995 domain-containing protein [Jeongeuplla avenae]